MTMSKARKVLRERNQIDEYFKVRAIEGAFLAFIVTMTFLKSFKG